LRKSKIDIEDKKFYLEQKIQGNIEFNNVNFSYPTSPAKIFKNLSFKIDTGKQIGFAGPSGCGKSTIAHLLLRFYDVDRGEILLDGVNIQEYNLSYLRKQISVVFQEPLLFNETLE
jgi:ABC-type multidrug transport system fused ATPase/permease subunit